MNYLWLPYEQGSQTHTMKAITSNTYLTPSSSNIVIKTNFSKLFQEVQLGFIL